MSAYDYATLKAHVGHRIKCVTYGDPKDPANVAIECCQCNAVLLDYDRPESDDE